MGKRTSGRKRGIQRGVAKHKIKSKPIEEEEDHELRKEEEGDNEIRKDNSSSAVFLGMPQHKISVLGQKCFEFLRRACEKLCLIPISRMESGVFIQMDLKRRIIHYSYLMLFILVTAQKTWLTVGAILTHSLQKETFMCISVLLAFYVPIFICAGVELRPKETVDLLNSFPYVLSCLREVCMEDLTPFHDISTSLNLIIVLIVAHGIALTGTVVCFAFPDMVTLWISSLEAWGVIPGGIAPRIVWQLLLLPLEYVTYMPPILMATFAGSVVLMSVGVLKIYARTLRKIPIRNLETRQRVEHLYVCLELFNGVFQVWFRFMVAPTIFGLSLTIIMGTFVAIRYTELPIFIYSIFPTAAASLMFILFWIAYDVVLSIRVTEGILSQLVSYESEYMRGGMSKAERTQLMKRARAMKPLEVLVGEFAEFSLNVPINVWEESMNQVLFLLSL